MPSRKFIPKEQLICNSLLKSSDKAVVNLSDHTLAKHEKILLSRGLTFCPQPSSRDKISLHRDTLIFNRRLRLNHYFHNAQPTETDPFKAPTGWTPYSGKSPTLDTYINVITNQILQFEPKKTRKSNITEQECLALKSLTLNQDIVIKPADKGGAIVVLNTTDYINEGLRQLINKTFYRKLGRNPIPKISADINSFLNFIKERKLLTATHLQFLTVKNPRTPIFYMLPKIHKINNPGH